MFKYQGEMFSFFCHLHDEQVSDYLDTFIISGVVTLYLIKYLEEFRCFLFAANAVMSKFSYLKMYSLNDFSGVQMIPISWREMQCPQTNSKEFRKVARVQPEYLEA